MKNVQRINESQLRAIVAESVKKVLRESEEYGDRNNDSAQEMLKELYMKAQNTEGYFQEECYAVLNNVCDYAGLAWEETATVRKQMEKIMMDCRQLRKMIGELGVIENYN